MFYKCSTIMATFKAEVYTHHKREDGLYNIKIRVIHNRQKKYLATQWYVSKDDLTRSMKIKNQRYIDYTDDLIRQYRKILDDFGESLKYMNVEQIVKLLESHKGGNNEFNLDIVEYTLKHIEHLKKTGHNGNARVYQVAINNLIKYTGKNKISIKEITADFLNKWIDWLRERPARPNRIKGERSQSSYPIQLRAIYNLARKEYNDEDSGIIRIPTYPFKHITIPKAPISRKRALSLEQLQTLSKLPYKKIMQPGNNTYNFAKDMFLLSFGLIGMNAVDLYNCTDYSDGRITYYRTKTKNRRADKAEMSVKIEPEIQQLFDKYKDPTGKRVFRFYQMYSSDIGFSVAINKALKRIGADIGEDDLEFYAARHTWATIALNEAEVDKWTVHTALNHVDDSTKVTDIYIRKSWQNIDKAHRKVLDLVQLKNLDVVEHKYKE